MITDHSQTSHAALSPSSAQRWMACPPSAKIAETKRNTTKHYAEEGSAAHGLAEIYLRHWLGEISQCEFNQRIHTFQETCSFYSKEMDDYVCNYVRFVTEEVSRARRHASDTVVLLEQHLDYSDWVPDGHGTCDVVIISGGILEVIDLKYGIGIPVKAEDNPQLRLYGLGAYQHYNGLYDIHTVATTIIQPRRYFESTQTLSLDELLYWAETEVKAKAEAACNGSGEFNPGEHCRFCDIKNSCRARANENMKLSQYEFAQPFELQPNELGDILARATELERWLKDVKAYATEIAATKGERIPGWKLVRGKSSRKYADEQKVYEALTTHYEPDRVAPRKVLGITALEQEIGKDALNKKLQGLITKPLGKPTLAPEHDVRPESHRDGLPRALADMYGMKMNS